MPEIHLYSDIDGTLNDSPFVHLQQMEKLGNDVEEVKRSPEFVRMLEESPSSPFYEKNYIGLYKKASKVVYHSGRDVYHRLTTIEWLVKHGIYDEKKCTLRLFPFKNREEYLRDKFKFLTNVIKKNEVAKKKRDISIFDDDALLVERVEEFIIKNDVKWSKVFLIQGGRLA